MGSSASKPPGGGEAAATAGSGEAGRPEKLGAGLLLMCGDEVLLLQRNSRHNHGTWGLPGGNADGTDGSLLETARREAREEMGPDLPPFQVVAELLTKRGKRGQKHYSVFVARITPADRAAWRPQLNEEHSAWRWFGLAQLGAAAPPQQLAANAQPPIPLHPVVELALRSEPHRQTVLQASSQP